MRISEENSPNIDLYKEEEILKQGCKYANEVLYGEKTKDREELIDFIIAQEISRKAEIQEVAMTRIKSSIDNLQKVKQIIPDLEELESQMTFVFENWDMYNTTKAYTFRNKEIFSIISNGMQTIAYILDCLKEEYK